MLGNADKRAKPRGETSAPERPSAIASPADLRQNGPAVRRARTYAVFDGVGVAAPPCTRIPTRQESAGSAGRCLLNELAGFDLEGLY